MDDLALQIAGIDDVEVDDADRAHARGREIDQNRRAQAARADGQDPAGLDLALSHRADLVHDQVPAVALHLFRGQRFAARDGGNHGDLVAVADGGFAAGE